MDDKDWDSLTPRQQNAAMAKYRAAQRRVSQQIKRQMGEMAAFVRCNPSAVIEARGDTSMRPGEISRYVFHIEVDAERFGRYQAERNAVKHG